MYSSILLTGMAWQAKGKSKFGGCKQSELQVSKETIPSQKFSFPIKIALHFTPHADYPFAILSSLEFPTDILKSIL